ncbi:hypothetical protein FJZ53_04085 [Candidatus Woesearchaeota archaeon]|nr:hypothetical protein [Candidatus Woesearchaeota archaeon]
MNKRGQSEVLTTTLMFELVIGALIAAMLMYAVMNVNQTSSFSKTYLEYDLDLVKEMAKSLPGDLDMVYYTGDWCLGDDGKFSKGKDCKVRITKTGEEVIAKGA